MSNIPENNSSHDHSHNSTRKLGTVSGINLIGFIVELIGGIMFGSVALMSDAFHMLFDALAYVMAFFSAYAAENWDANDNYNFGFHRIETLSAFFNGALLIPMAGYILWESYKRFLNPVEIGVVPTIAIGFGGLLVNLFSVYYLQGGEMSLNERGAFYHLLGDAGGSIAVILSTSVIYFTGITAIDPAVAVLIAGLIVWSAAKVLRESFGILMQKSPIPATEIEQAIESVEGVEDAHHIRVYEVCSKVCIASAHAQIKVDSWERADNIRKEITEKLKQEFNIQTVTLQIEKDRQNHGEITH